MMIHQSQQESTQRDQATIQQLIKIVSDEDSLGVKSWLEKNIESKKQVSYTSFTIYRTHKAKCLHH